MGDLLSLEVIVVSAGNLNKLEHSPKMKTYAVVTLTGGASADQKFQTNVDTNGGENPSWNFPMKFIVGRTAANAFLSFTLMSETAAGDEYIGHVELPVAELVKSVGDGINSMQYVSCPVVETLGRTTWGEINFKYRFVTSPARVGHVQQGLVGDIGKEKVMGVGIDVAGDCMIQSLFPHEAPPFGIETFVVPDIESMNVSNAPIFGSTDVVDASIIESTNVLNVLLNESVDVFETSVVEPTEVFDGSVVESTDDSDAS